MQPSWRLKGDGTADIGEERTRRPHPIWHMENVGGVQGNNVGSEGIGQTTYVLHIYMVAGDIIEPLYI